MPGQPRNLFADLPQQLDAELVDVLAQGAGVRVERITSTGHASPEGFWYDSDQNEWVSVLRGEAQLQFADATALVHLRPGDHLLIAAHRRHRVHWTSGDEPTVWLAVYFS